MTQDAQSVTQADRAVYKELQGYFAGTTRAKEVDDGEHDATWEMRILVAHRLASQPTSAEDAVAWLYERDGEREVQIARASPALVESRGWTETALGPIASRPTPDTQTAAIGAEAMRKIAAVVADIREGNRRLNEGLNEIAALSQPVAAPQAEMAPAPSGRAQGEGITISRQLYDFLLGQGEIDGVWFGARHGLKRGNYWWRKLLRSFDAAPPAQDQTKGGEA